MVLKKLNSEEELPYRKGYHKQGAVIPYLGQKVQVLLEPSNKIEHASESFQEHVGKKLQMLIRTGFNQKEIFEQGLFVAVDNSCWIAEWGVYWYNFRRVGERKDGKINIKIMEKIKTKKICKVCGHEHEKISYNKYPINFKLEPLTQTIRKQCIVCDRMFVTTDSDETFCDDKCEDWWMSLPYCDCIGDQTRYKQTHPKPTAQEKRKRR